MNRLAMSSMQGKKLHLCTPRITTCSFAVQRKKGITSAFSIDNGLPRTSLKHHGSRFASGDTFPRERNSMPEKLYHYDTPMLGSVTWV